MTRVCVCVRTPMRAHLNVCLCVCVCVWPAGDDLLLLLSVQLDWKVSDFLVFITQNGIGVYFFLYHLFIRLASEWRPAWCRICLRNMWFCNPTPLSQEVILTKATVMLTPIWVDLFGFLGGGGGTGGGVQARFCTHTWQRPRTKLKGMVYNHVDWKFHFVILLQGHGTLWCAPRYFSAPALPPQVHGNRDFFGNVDSLYCLLKGLWHFISIVKTSLFETCECVGCVQSPFLCYVTIHSDF